MEDMQKWAALQPICLECFKDKRMQSTLREINCLSLVQNKEIANLALTWSFFNTQTNQFFYEESLNILTSLKILFFFQETTSRYIPKKKALDYIPTNVPAPCKFPICDNNDRGRESTQ